MAEHEWNSGEDITNENYGLNSEAESIQPAEPTSAEIETEKDELAEEIGKQSDLEAALAEEYPDVEQNEETEQPAPPDKERVEALSKEFKELFGVDVSDAVESMNTFKTQAEEITNQINQARQSLALQQQRMDLSFAWMNDAQAEGKDVSELVEERLSVATEAYAKLSPAMQKRIAQEGSRGILSLYRHISGGIKKVASNPPPSTPSGGRAQIAQNQNQGTPADLSTLLSLESDDEYWAAMAKLRSGQAQINDDYGLRTRRK